MTTPRDDASRPDDASADQGPLDERASEELPRDQTDESSSIPARSSEDESGPDPASADSTETEGGEGLATDDDGLPEWEPLTPELVEDEAIRADFMLRWAVVLLAFLLGCTEISETATLVHVKTGQYIASQSWWPTATDVFSYTAGDRPWINLSWLFDLAVTGVFAVGGAVALSFFKAFLAAVTFGIVVKTSQRGLSTWWGSVCAVLALLVCYPQFTALPESITLLGVALTLWLLHGWEEGQSQRLWWLVPIYLVWANTDPRMFLGLALLVLFAVGEAIGLLMRRSPLTDGGHRRQLWIVVAACFGAALLNPFGWHSLTAAWTLYNVEYPARQLYAGSTPSAGELPFFPMIGAEYWQTITHHTIAGLLLLATTLVTFALNFSRLSPAHVLVFLGAVGFALIGSHELAAASLIASVLATLNAQLWYQANFRQTYTVETSELLFSRGGRALTVLAFFGLAFLTVSGRLEGPDGRRVGYGFDHDLQILIDGFEEELADSFDKRPFNFVLDQGDVLIWLDQQPFIDNRIALYKTGGEDLLAIHRATRAALRQPREPSGELSLPSHMADSASAQNPGYGRPDIWKETFDRFQVTHVMPRLSGLNPDYVTCVDLLESADWELVRFGAVTAVFYRTDTNDPDLDAYLKENRVNFTERAFKTAPDPPGQRTDWARPRTFYAKYLSLPETKISRPVQQASHYARFLTGTPPTFSFGAAMAYLAIRKANEGLVEDPSSARAYRILGHAYSYLGDLESQVAQFSGVNYPNWLRFYQALHAYNQALIIAPDDPATHFRLFQTYNAVQKLDLALRELRQFDRLMPDVENPTDADIQQRRQIEAALEQLTATTDRVAQQIQVQMTNQANHFQVAQMAYQNGCVLKALQLLEEAEDALLTNPTAQRFYAMMLMEAGRSEEAFQVLGRLEGVAEQIGLPGWRSPAALASLAIADYDRAIQLWSDEIREQEMMQTQALLHTLPFIQPPPIMISQAPGAWPIQQLASAHSHLYEMPQTKAALHYNAATCYLEMGQLQMATRAFQKVLDAEPETHLRPLVIQYLYELTGELVDPEPPSDWIPVTPDLFAPEPDPQEEASPQTEQQPPQSDSGAAPRSSSEPESQEVEDENDSQDSQQKEEQRDED